LYIIGLINVIVYDNTINNAYDLKFASFYKHIGNIIIFQCSIKLLTTWFFNFWCRRRFAGGFGAKEEIHSEFVWNRVPIWCRSWPKICCY